VCRELAVVLGSCASCCRCALTCRAVSAQSEVSEGLKRVRAGAERRKEEVAKKVRLVRKVELETAERRRSHSQVCRNALPSRPSRLLAFPNFSCFSLLSFPFSGGNNGENDTASTARYTDRITNSRARNEDRKERGKKGN
jgi:hypothetical protein